MGTTTDVRAWLDDHVDLERLQAPAPAPTLERMRRLVEVLGSPQTAYPVVHVTGTNGKTSTARMTAALLAARGLSVGLYTSPHLARVNERIEWNGQPVGDDDLDAVLDSIRRVEDLVVDAVPTGDAGGAGGARPTYFEIVTAAAFSRFADVAVDAAVVEVGLGGTWDATNVADGAVAVVTNVGVDHVEYLGPTRHAIAKEKAGIVKEGCTLVLGETDPELVPLFTGPERPYGAGNTAGSRPGHTHRRGTDFGVRANVMAHHGRLVTLYAAGNEYEDVFLPVHGAHQADNAACALAAAEAFFGSGPERPLRAGGAEPFDPEVVREAFATVELPGRLEVVGRSPLVVLDGAHNADGARALRAALAEEFRSIGRTLVVGILREREPQEMLESLGLLDAERLVVCRPPSPRALDPQTLAAAAENVGMPSAMIEVAEYVPEALARALAVTPEQGQVVVTGSLYTVGAARSVLVDSRE